MSVTLHRGYSGQGLSQSFAKTRHDLDTTKIGRNEACSVTLTNRSKIVLFSKSDCRGSAAWLNKSVANLKHTPVGGKEKNFHKKVKSILVKPIEIPISAKVIMKDGKLPGPFSSLDMLLFALNKAIKVQNRETWEGTLIQFKAVDKIYKITNHRELFNLDYDSSKDKKTLRELQRDPHRMDLYIVNRISSAAGFCSGGSKLGKDLGCVIGAGAISEESGEILSHEFGHHLGLGHRNADQKNLMKRGGDGNGLLPGQISDMHNTIAKKLSNYRLKY